MGTVFFKPEMSRDALQRHRQINQHFMDWVVDVETNVLKETAWQFSWAYGKSKYIKLFSRLLGS